MNQDPDFRNPPAAPAQPLDALIAERIRNDGPMSLAGFMRLALYHPEHGYYRRDRRRIGADPESDFVTAYSTGPVFADLVTAAARRLMDPTVAAGATWVEIGVDRQKPLWPEPPPPFRDVVSLGRDDPLVVPSPAAVFSNELFDAQPFNRVRFLDGSWKETGVGLDRDGARIEVPLPTHTSEVTALLPRLPTTAPEGAIVDLPTGAVGLLDDLAAQDWRGLILIFDYGKSWESLSHEFPQGTLRAYRHHRQSPDILARPGEQDLTGHICWDWMTACLEKHGFNQIELLNQETFFVRHAAPAIETLIGRHPGQPDPARSRLHQLIHPAHMGQKFQVLSARR